MKNKNQKGFTLIELIVVIALLTVMMGAILQLMGPIRQVYNTTLNTVNTKTAGETIISYIEDKTRYSTDMLVLKDYEGVPQISPVGTSESFKVGNCSAVFKECIIVDNSHTRNEMFADFSTNALTSRKNCTGTIYTLKDLGGKAYLDLTKAKAGSIGDDVYGAYTYDTDIFLQENKYQYSLYVDVDSYAMENQNDVFVPANEPEYTASRKFDLININIDRNDAYKIWDFIDFGTAADYTKYPQATAPTELSAKLQGFYNTSNKYTYIFYNVKDTNESVKVKFTFQYDTSDASFSKSGEILAIKEVNAGKYLDEVAVPTPVWPRTGFTGYYYTSGGTNYDKEGISQIQATEDMTFTVIYKEDPTIVRHNVTFKNADGTVASTGKVQDGLFATDPGAPTTGYDSNTQSYQWLTTSGGTLEGTAIIADTTFIANVKDKYVVGFYIDDTASTLYEPVQYITGGKKGEAGGPTAPATTPPAPSGQVFDNWYVVGDPTKTVDDYTVASDTKFFAKFKTAPPATVTVSLSQPNFAWWETVYYEVTINNLTSADKSNWTVKFNLPSGATLGNTPWNVDVSMSGTTVTAKGNSNSVVTAGSSLTFNIYFSCSGIGNDASAIPSTYKNITATIS